LVGVFGWLVLFVAWLLGCCLFHDCFGWYGGFVCLVFWLDWLFGWFGLPGWYDLMAWFSWLV
jgi:hypothetical protein